LALKRKGDLSGWSEGGDGPWPKRGKSPLTRMTSTAADKLWEKKKADLSSRQKKGELQACCEKRGTFLRGAREVQTGEERGGLLNAK